MNRNQIKLSTIAAVLVFLGIVSNISPQFSSKAEGDEILTAIADYKNWTKMTKKPIRIRFLDTGKTQDVYLEDGVGISANG